MKYNFKISLPLYKMLYSIAFMLLFALIRPTTTISEILVVIEPNVCLLAIIFISDVFYCEIRENRIDVFYMFPEQHKYKTIMQRFLIDIMYLILLVVVFFWVYVAFQRLHNNSLLLDGILSIYGYTILSCFMTMLFFAAMSCTLVNYFQNLWIGIGISASVWLIFSTTAKEYLPVLFNIFLYKTDPGNNARIIPYFLSRGVFALIGVGLLRLNYFIVVRSPRRKVKR